jgi:Fe-S-cluster-containing dehydrogenase component
MVCNLACSFHHTRAFFPEQSSIHITADGKGIIQTMVLPSCDLCANETRPLCLEFCPVGAVSLQGKTSGA